MITTIALCIGFLVVGYGIGYIRTDFIVNTRWRSNAHDPEPLWDDAAETFYKVVLLHKKSSWEFAARQKKRRTIRDAVVQILLELRD